VEPGDELNGRVAGRNRPRLRPESAGDIMSLVEQPLTVAEAEQVIQRIAVHPLGVGFRSHCLEQMEKRGFDAVDIVKMLRNPSLVCPAYRREGEWRYKVMERPGNAPPPRRGIHVVVVIITEERLQAHTVFKPRGRMR